MPPPSTKPTLHYFDIGSMGRGEVVRLFLRDANIDFEDHRFAYDETWPATSADLEKKGISRTGKVPVLEYDGALLTQHIPILRHVARELGCYDGSTSLEKHVVDVVADIYIDWRYRWVDNLGEAKAEFKDTIVPKYYDVLAQYYSDRGGPYLLGDRITYADFAVYQSIDNNEKVKTLPAILTDAIAKFRAAFEARPNIASYLKSRS